MWNPTVLMLHTTPNLVDWWPLPLYFVLTCRLTAAEIRFLRSTKEKNSNRDEDTMMMMLMRRRKRRYLIYLLSAIVFTPNGSSAVHIYIQTIHRTTQLTSVVWRLSGIRTQSGQTKINDELTVYKLSPNWEECGPCSVFASYTLACALQLRKKHKKTSVRVA